jgi:hypothetical protein
MPTSACSVVQLTTATSASDATAAATRLPSYAQAHKTEAAETELSDSRLSFDHLHDASSEVNYGSRLYVRSVRRART